MRNIKWSAVSLVLAGIIVGMVLGGGSGGGRFAWALDVTQPLAPVRSTADSGGAAIALDCGGGSTTYTARLAQNDSDVKFYVGLASNISEANASYVINPGGFIPLYGTQTWYWVPASGTAKVMRCGKWR